MAVRGLGLRVYLDPKYPTFLEFPIMAPTVDGINPAVPIIRNIPIIPIV